MEFDVIEWVKNNKPHYLKQVGDCIEWQGTMQHNNPRICIKKRFYWPRSATYKNHFGKKLNKSDVITFSCGNSRCLNQKHMLVTAANPYKTLSQIGSYEHSIPHRLKGILKEIFQKWPEHINRDGQCYIWAKSFHESVPVFYKDGKTIYLRSTIYKDYHGNFDKKRFSVKMTCNDPACLNPAHMELQPNHQPLLYFAESGQANSIHVCLKRTLNNQYRKLTFDNVAYIRSSEKTNKELSKMFDVHAQSIRMIKAYRRFKVIPTSFGLMKVG